MLEVKNISVMNFENALRGARNPMNSWEKGDSHYNSDGLFIIGEKDLYLAKKLCKAGSDHRKFLRQIFISVDINAPLYWWKEFDTYKVGTVANSTSTMHKIHSQAFDIKQFSHDHMTERSREQFISQIQYLEELRTLFIETRDKQYWYDLIQLLPSSYNQLRTCTCNYETMINIYCSRKNHKLYEWHTFCEWIKTLPYAKDLILIEG